MNPKITITAAVLALSMAGCGGGSAPLSPACRNAVAAQNAYVQIAIAKGYPNIDVADGMAILHHDLLLMKAARKVCPGSTKVKVLPGG